jgi:arylsulfatase A-like enzyme
MKRHPPVVLLLVLVLGGACGCQESRPNLLLISIDTLRADVLGCYGNQRPASPAIDAFARQGALFEAALAPSPWTLPSHASLLTGLYPLRHGVTTHRRRLPTMIPTWAGWLRSHGFFSAAIVNAKFVSRRWGLHRGFERFLYVQGRPDLRQPSGVEARATRWLSEGLPEPFFLFLHFFDVHAPYEAQPTYESMFVGPYDGDADGSLEQLLQASEGAFQFDAEDARHLTDLYTAGVRQIDEGIGRLLMLLERLGHVDDTIIILTSDHGEEFLDHGGVLHAKTQYEEVMRVPLIIRGPGVPAGVRVSQTVSLVDVMTTVLALAGVPLPPDLDGVDLSPLLGGGADPFEDRFIFGEASINNKARSVRYRNFKLIRDHGSDTYALYDLEADPGEHHDVKEDHPETASLLLRRLEQRWSGIRHEAPRTTLEPEELEQLRALGYLVE